MWLRVSGHFAQRIVRRVAQTFAMKRRPSAICSSRPESSREQFGHASCVRRDARFGFGADTLDKCWRAFQSPLAPSSFLVDGRFHTAKRGLRIRSHVGKHLAEIGKLRAILSSVLRTASCARSGNC